MNDKLDSVSRKGRLLGLEVIGDNSWGVALKSSDSTSVIIYNTYLSKTIEIPSIKSIGDCRVYKHFIVIGVMYNAKSSRDLLFVKDRPYDLLKRNGDQTYVDLICDNSMEVVSINHHMRRTLVNYKGKKLAIKDRSLQHNYLIYNYVDGLYYGQAYSTLAGHNDVSIFKVDKDLTTLIKLY